MILLLQKSNLIIFFLFKFRNKIILVEGNYLFLQEDNWKKISNFFDEKWFIKVDIDISMERVRKRHLETGLTNEQAIFRIEDNDRKNGILINESIENIKIDKIIESKNY